MSDSIPGPSRSYFTLPCTYRTTVPPSAVCTPDGADGGEEITTLVGANQRDGATTVNLLAPVLVNKATPAAAQVILDGQGYEVRSTLSRN